MNGKVSIEFFLYGKRYTCRYWHHAPRVGDEVMLHVPGKEDREPFVVKRAVWGVEPEDGPIHVQYLNIEIEPAEDQNNG